MQLSSCISLVISVYSPRPYRCWPGLYFWGRCWAHLWFLSGCFGIGTCQRKLLKPTVAVGERSGRLPKSGLFFCRRRFSQIFLGVNLGNLLGIIYARSIYMAVTLYTA